MARLLVVTCGKMCIRDSVKGAVLRKNISIIMLDDAGVNHLTQWDLGNAWVSRWNGAVLNALTSEVAFESMALAFDTLERV